MRVIEFVSRRMRCIRQGSRVAAAACGLVLIAAPGRAHAGGCGTITPVGVKGTCGIVIRTSGCYRLAAAQTAASGVADCIVVEASNVYLSLAGQALTGTGSSDTGAGVHVIATNPATSKPVSLVTIAGDGSTVTKFGLGVLVEASKVRVEDVGTGHNNLSGIKLSGASGCVLANDSGYNNNGNGMLLLKSSANLISNSSLTNNRLNGILLSSSSGNTLSNNLPFQNGRDGIHLDASNKNLLLANGLGVGALGASSGQNHNGIVLNASNGNTLSGNASYQDKSFGFWLLSSSGNLLLGDNGSDSGVAGIYLGCSATGPKPANTCATNSNNNRIQGGGWYGANSKGVAVTHYGIALDKGSSANVIDFSFTQKDTADDLVDNNPNCGTNTWFGDVFTGSVSPPSCIH